MPHPDPAVPPSPAPSPGKPRWTRRQYVVDAKTQFRVAGLLIGGLAVLAAVQGATLLTCFSPPADALYDGGQVRALLFQVGLLQFVVTAVLGLALGVLLSHRFVGAALVLRRAIAGMRSGDHSCRLTLRKTDFLHDVATDLAALRDEMTPRSQESAPPPPATPRETLRLSDRSQATVA